MNNFALQTVGLTKRYGDRIAVNNLSIDIPEGVVCGFIGRNGAGKTTTIRMLLGLIEPTSGTAEVLGHSSKDPKTYLHQVGAMIEGPAFYPSLTARQNLEVLRRLGRLPKSSIDRVLTIVGLDHRADELVKGYSLGMKQRLGIAAALLPDPKLLVLDEPTNGLDPQGIREVRELLGQFSEDGITVLVSSHLLDELQHVADHLVLINDGSLAFQGSAEELLERSAAYIVVEPEFEQDLSLLTRTIASEGFAITTKGSQVLVTPDRGLTTAGVNRLAAANGITLATLMLNQSSLEQIFFEMTAPDEEPVKTSSADLVSPGVKS